MAAVNPFTPTGPTVKVSATSSNSTASLVANSNQFRVVNLGPNKAFIRWGLGTQTATVADMPVFAGGEVISKAIDVVNFGVICDATETATLYLTPGEGL